MKKEQCSDNRDVKSKSQSLERGLLVLEAISGGASDIGVRELARDLNLAKSIVQRLLNTLLDRGFVEQDSVTRKYCIGARAFEIGSSFTRSGNLAQIAAPELEQLTKQHQLNSYLGVLRDNTALYLSTLQSSGPIAIQVSPGDRIPLHSTALGKALLLDMSDAAIRELLAGTALEKRTNRTKRSIPQLIKEIRLAKQRGYTLSVGENLVGIYSIGAPLYDANGHIVAAISGALPSEMINRDSLGRLCAAIVMAAARISQRLGAPRWLLSSGSATEMARAKPAIAPRSFNARKGGIE